MTSLLLTDKYTNAGSRQKAPKDIQNADCALSLKCENKVLFENMPIVVTRYVLTTQDNVQVVSTIGSDLYIHILGKQPYTLTLSGILFNDACSENSLQKGVEKFIKEYETYRAYQGKVISVALGELHFKAVWGNLQVANSMENASSLKTFNLSLIGIKS